jgi:DNA-binding IclR family transcriptional regulator
MAKDPRAAPSKDNSLTRMLELLDLFTPAAPYWSVDSLIRFTGASRATIYRHVRALHEAGFIRPVANGNYIIGPRIIELDRQLRQTDPLYIAGDGIMRKLAEDTGHSVLLCALFSDSVMCVREELIGQSPPNLLSRGQKRPLFTGAASKIILPFLPPHQLRGVYAKHKKAIATAGLGSDWTAFRDALAEMRKAGYVSTVGEFNPGVLGLSAPVFNRSGQVLGSLGIAGEESRFHKTDMEALAATVMASANAITTCIGMLDSDLDFPPRAIG